MLRGLTMIMYVKKLQRHWHIERPLGSHCCAVLCARQDGALDLYVTTAYGNNHLYRNLDTTAASRGYFVRPVDAMGRTHTSTTLGAVVSVFAAGSTTRIHGSGGVWIDSGGGSYNSQNDFDAYFALQDANALVDIEIRYPNPKMCKATKYNVKPSEDFEDTFGRRVFPATAPRFVDTTSCAGVEGNSVYSSHAAAWTDYDGDGNVDVVVTTGGQVPLLYRNEGNGVFKDAAGKADLPAVANAAVAWGDFNGDGPSRFCRNALLLFTVPHFPRSVVCSAAFVSLAQDIPISTPGATRQVVAAGASCFVPRGTGSSNSFLTPSRSACVRTVRGARRTRRPRRGPTMTTTAGSTCSSRATGRCRTYSCTTTGTGRSPTKRSRPA